MRLHFAWDPEKAAENLEKHGISFDDAATVFGDFLARTKPDPLHSEFEDRDIILGEAESGRLLVVSYTVRGRIIRIISARTASKKERHAYESH